jgi:hypothetical protein
MLNLSSNIFYGAVLASQAAEKASGDVIPSGARSDFRTPVVSIGLQIPKDLLLFVFNKKQQMPLPASQIRMTAVPFQQPASITLLSRIE